MARFPIAFIFMRLCVYIHVPARSAGGVSEWLDYETIYIHSPRALRGGVILVVAAPKMGFAFMHPREARVFMPGKP